MTTDPYPSVFVKRAHRPSCDGSLYRLGAVAVDRTGRIGNGGIVCHDYRCNESWAGCPARVLVTEHAVRMMAVDAMEADRD